MKNNWSKNFANKYIKKYKKLGFSKDLALRVYTTHLLGRNKELVLHGGGNTSVKTTIKDIDGKKYKIRWYYEKSWWTRNNRFFGRQTGLFSRFLY